MCNILVNSFPAHHSSKRWVILLCTFYRWAIWGRVCIFIQDQGARKWEIWDMNAEVGFQIFVPNHCSLLSILSHIPCSTSLQYPDPATDLVLQPGSLLPTPDLPLQTRSPRVAGPRAAAALAFLLRNIWLSICAQPFYHFFHMNLIFLESPGVWLRLPFLMSLVLAPSQPPFLSLQAYSIPVSSLSQSLRNFSSDSLPGFSSRPQHKGQILKLFKSSLLTLHSLPPLSPAFFEVYVGFCVSV